MIIQNTIHCCLPQTSLAEVPHSFPRVPSQTRKHHCIRSTQFSREYNQINQFYYFNYIMNYDQCLFSLIGYYLVAARLSWFFTILVKRQ
uniref:Uncharacterized protein n=1 Tax=Xenopus tropicalis TaxID=8364 RepID=A0A1B8XVP0_XENTR